MAGVDTDGSQRAPTGRVLEVVLAFMKLGLTSFGGPVAHIGYFRGEFVERRRWIDDAAFTDLVALCQMLPGPASSQLGIALGMLRAGWLGGLVAWMGFTLPSAAALVAFGYGIAHFGALATSPAVHGLKVVAVAVVAQAVWVMARTLCPDRLRRALAIAATVLVLLVPGTPGQLSAMTIAGVLGAWLIEAPSAAPTAHSAFRVSRTAGSIALALFFLLLAVLPAAALVGNDTLAMIDRFYRAGALVFGGGHVVLPLLQASVVPPGWVGDSAFLAGYGAAQAVPGPLFTFAAYLGTVMRVGPGGWVGGLLALSAIFLPAALLVVGALPFWNALRRRPAMQAALSGVNAAVVGVLLAALYDPVWTSAIHSRADFGLAAVCFAMLHFARVSPVWVVAFAAIVAAVTQ
jgi:chromate transporter